MHDHRKLGRELGLFGTDPLIGAGLPYWLPDGATVRHTLEEYVRGLERRAGYQHVYSPVAAKRELYEISGHWSHYGQDMYPPMDLGGEQMLLRPSLCPHHALIFHSRARSYRELPLRRAEIGGMYRAELSGVLGGLTRVRSIQLDDAHLFCTDELPHAAALARRCLDLDLRAQVVGSEHGTLGARIRAWRLAPYQVVIGSKEAAGDEVAVRLRDGRRLEPLPAAEFAARINSLIGARSTALWDVG